METVPGDTVWVRVTLRLVEEDGERYLDGIASDVTDRRELARRRERAETIFEHTQDALFLIDVGDDRRFTIRSVNRAYEELTGYSPDELKGRTPRELLGNDQGAEVEANFEKCVEKCEPIEYDEQLTLGETTKDWHTRLAPVIEDDRVIQLVGATRDITDQRERQRRYGAIFNQTYQFTGLLEPDGALIEANETALEFGGLDPDDVLGKKIWETYWFQHSEETRERAREAVERAADGEFVRHELPVQGTDREAIIDFSVRPIRDERGAITLLIPEGRDITEKKQREQELQEESERFQAIFEKAFDAMVIADDEGTFIDVNGSATELFDLPREEVLGRSIEEFAPEDFDFEAAWREFQASDRDRGEFPLVRPDGTERIVEYAATRNIIPGQHLSVLRDVTDRKDRVALLEALNETAQELMTASTQAEVAEIGVSAARDVLDLTVSGIHLYDDAQEGLVPVAQTEESKNLVGEEPTFTEGDSIAWRVYKSGEPRALDDVQGDPDVHNPDTPVRGELYLPIGDYGVLLNASETPQAFEREDIVLGELLAGTIATALEQIERTERVHTCGRDLKRQNERLQEFTSVVSHDLRNPLRTAEGNLELLKEECDSDRIEALDHSLTRMDDLIEDLLTLAREGKKVSEIRVVDLGDLSETCWQTVETKLARFVTDVDRPIQADRSRLQQLLENLFRNAIEHGGGDVTVTVRELDDGFYVADDGPGIPEETRGEVFEAGYSTSQQGIGFGLAIVEQVVEAHDWSIRVSNGPDGGARFEITGVTFTDE